MVDWQPLTVADAHFLDELTAALREARIEYRLSDAVEPSPAGVRTFFGERGGAAQTIEVPRAQLEMARGVLAELLAGAGEAAEHQSGAPAPTEAERAAERAWRDDVERRRARTSRIGVWILRLFFVAIVVVLVAAIVYALG
jgi:hypothetical protein